MKRFVYQRVKGYGKAWFAIFSLRYWKKKNINIFWGIGYQFRKLKKGKGIALPFLKFSRGKVGPTWPKRRL